ncbi:MAG: hypothetical protein O7E57_06070 [Gammaproteobacteria bacterium]|nr:hypothetical protein [Gammaproteobacteria bacterium]
MSKAAANSSAIATARAFIDAFNNQDHEALADTLNYPHVRLANQRFATTESRDDFIKRSRKGGEYLDAEGWHHTVLDSIEVIHGGLDKVHMALGIDRCREDGSVYNHFETLWIATLQEKHWGIQFRSSYL